jgi:hypothetical protein
MPVVFKVMTGISAACLFAGLIAFCFRWLAAGITLSCAAIASVSLFIFIGMDTDPPSLAPFWGWGAGLLFGDIPGWWFRRWRRSLWSAPAKQSDDGAFE